MTNSDRGWLPPDIVYKHYNATHDKYTSTACHQRVHGACNIHSITITIVTYVILKLTHDMLTFILIILIMSEDIVIVLVLCCKLIT